MDVAIPRQRSPLGEPLGHPPRHWVCAENRRSMARPARGVSESSTCEAVRDTNATDVRAVIENARLGHSKARFMSRPAIVR